MFNILYVAFAHCQYFKFLLFQRSYRQCISTEIEDCFFSQIVSEG